MAVGNIRNLLEQLLGHEVVVFFEDEEQEGRLAAVTDDLLILCSDDDVVWIDIEDITAVRVVNGSHHGDDDDE